MHCIYYEKYDEFLTQPHLMIAGATGSGKSVIINGLIYHIMQRVPRDETGGAQMILIDPKRVELSAYRRDPGTLRYASEPRDMVDALTYAMELCERRYQKMQFRGLKKHPGSDVYIIIDEFADLMTTQRRTVQPLIQRLAQIGRAARIHIILATQTPIAKVIPTEIKCNFDSRLGLRTRSAQDSRNILGRSGLETLPQYGQAVYMSPTEDMRFCVPMIPDAEIESLLAARKHTPKRKPGLLRKLFSRKN